ncbi:MAG: hypothetical protein ACMXYA_03640, partial [Candidatus Woesearchaeota archaeon]
MNIKGIFFLDYTQYLQRAEDELNEYAKKNDFWDPIQKTPSVGEIVEQNKKAYAQYLSLKQNPRFFRKQRIATTLLALVLATVAIFLLCLSHGFAMEIIIYQLSFVEAV